jgi:methylglutaconyl-CoA hydratase
MDSVRITHDGGVTVLEMARPESGNALDARLIEELTSAIARCPEGGSRAVVISGAGKHFCTGAHLDELARLANAPLPARLADASHLAVLYTAVLRCPLPTFAAVHGAVYGGGVGLAGACDFVIAAPTARFQFSEVRLGFVPALISVFLPRRVPAARLATLFLDPAPLDASAALACGLVDEVVDDPLRRAVERARGLAAKGAPSALAETKRLLLTLQLPQLDQQLAHAAQVNAAQRTHPECQRGVASFLADHAFPSWLDDD